jgi:hypothetical protein
VLWPTRLSYGRVSNDERSGTIATGANAASEDRGVARGDEGRCERYRAAPCRCGWSISNGAFLRRELAVRSGRALFSEGRPAMRSCARVAGWPRAPCRSLPRYGCGSVRMKRSSLLRLDSEGRSFPHARPRSVWRAPVRARSRTWCARGFRSLRKKGFEYVRQVLRIDADSRVCDVEPNQFRVDAETNHDR